MTATFPLISIPLLPLLGAALILTLGQRLPRRAISIFACTTVAASFGVALFAVFARLLPLSHLAEAGGSSARLIQRVYEWIRVGSLHLNIGLTCDALSAVMILVITGIGLLIHIYSAGYMSHERDYPRFFGYLNLFTGAMLMLVLGDNLVVLFFGWEGVGLCSYLLIGFWYDRDGPTKPGLANASAGRKAFLVNRIGDFAFLLGMLVLFGATGTLGFAEMPAQISALGQTQNVFGYGPYFVTTLAALLLFIGATGKSAQIPLYIWLPDAMAGPTPVSALIHAATMVTAGIYMIARMNFLYLLAPAVMGLVALVGALTALFAATIAFAQNDIKKVLAYSTVSQLGYMFIGVGVGAFSAGVFHLFTHAFFKACLFLGAGAVIHALHGEQDIRRMGGLKNKVPVTHWTFLISTWAISGLPPFSGFFSKDEILWKALSMGNPAYGSWLPITVYGLGMIAALCTPFYMFRVYCLTFLGPCRLDQREVSRIHPPSLAMRLPLVVLAAGAAVAGILGLPELLGHSLGIEHINIFHHWLSPVVGAGTGLAARLSRPHVAINALATRHGLEAASIVVSIAVAVFSSWLGYRVYRNGPSAAAERLSERFAGLYRLVRNKYWIDEVYRVLFVTPYRLLSFVFFRVIDRAVIDRGLVHGVAKTVSITSRLSGFLHNGNLQRYIVALVLGIASLIYFASRPPETEVPTAPARTGNITRPLDGLRFGSRRGPTNSLAGVTSPSNTSTREDRKCSECY